MSEAGTGAVMECANIVGSRESSNGVYAGEVARVVGWEIQGWKADSVVE